MVVEWAPRRRPGRSTTGRGAGASSGAGVADQCAASAVAGAAPAGGGWRGWASNWVGWLKGRYRRIVRSRRLTLAGFVPWVEGRSAWGKGRRRHARVVAVG